ncbi:HesB/IscA family protein [Nonomuraea angiospora]|uniref:Fe-S cluster assembly iron-binding protein IscA n=1 Tax=Nonomuraea angiospora TaxID=46172 RepID=A0ABR9MN17_9ACTN|nr:iron-sulfur cluster biosynthesis family protein [Nonomuraea angiospora]MBE1593756.1 Fe-S cluster assembly iron-binding protein IscA [Nonomuraea angiospora]MDX3105318.1 iron-sulfur cluster biosynthesis family protein [Nonomuraea angiospora]
MLTLTANAAQAIRDLTSSAPEPSQSGIRISSQGEGASSLTLTLATAPEPADEVVEAEGARVYLDPVAATVLEDKSLDAGADDQGSVSFLVKEQTA